jgi:hypothetical protein
MPKILRQNLPHRLMNHLLDRIESRSITNDDLIQFSEWLTSNPEVPHGRWFKRFPGMTVCGEGVLVKTFLLPHQAATGEEVL